MKEIEIKKGHKSSKTTENWMNVSSKDFRKIKSPLDQILQEGTNVYEKG